MPIPLIVAAVTAAVLLASAEPSHAQASAPVYRCPGTPVLYTDALTPQQAVARGCTSIEGTPITIVQTTRRPPPPTASSAPSAGRSATERVEPDVQRQRDADARRILSDELNREESALAALRREFNNGQPERRGDESNYQRYLDRVAEMKASIARKEADVGALKRELAKLPQ